MNFKYYSVLCHRGHCGTKKSTDIKFVFQATNLLEAMDAAKMMPGVKHTRMIIAAKEISYEEYVEYKKISAYKRAELGS